MHVGGQPQYHSSDVEKHARDIGLNKLSIGKPHLCCLVLQTPRWVPHPMIDRANAYHGNRAYGVRDLACCFLDIKPAIAFQGAS